MIQQIQKSGEQPAESKRTAASNIKDEVEISLFDSFFRIFFNVIFLFQVKRESSKASTNEMHGTAQTRSKTFFSLFRIYFLNGSLNEKSKNKGWNQSIGVELSQWRLVMVAVLDRWLVSSMQQSKIRSRSFKDQQIHPNRSSCWLVDFGSIFGSFFFHLKSIPFYFSISLSLLSDRQFGSNQKRVEKCARGHQMARESI